jgi:hypothetical protein
VQPVSKQRIGKHASTTIGLLSEMVLSIQSLQSGYEEDNWGNPVGEPSRVEAGLNTSAIALRVIGGNEKGSLEYETVKYGHESHGTQTRE